MPKRRRRTGSRGRRRKRPQKKPERGQSIKKSDSKEKRCSPPKDVPVPPETSNRAVGEVVAQTQPGGAVGEVVAQTQPGGLFQTLLLFVWNIAGHIKEGFNQLVGLGRGKKRPISVSCQEPCKKKRRVSGSPREGEKHDSAEQEKTGRRKRKRSSSHDETCPSTKKALVPSHARLSVPGPTSLVRLSFQCVLGEGGYGRVLLATDSVSKQKLAVKMVSKRVMLKAGVEAVFLERRILNIASGSLFLTHAVSTFQTEDHLCYVMEYLSGGTLFDILEKPGRLDINTARFLAAEIVCGLQFLHNNGIIHRDLKPDNILLDGAGHIRIADFGLALENMFGDAKAVGYAGTYGYIAPEMYRGQSYNHAVDWWAFGVILYQMVTGSYPFHFSEDENTMKISVLRQTPEYPKWLSSDTKDILQMLLNKFGPSRMQMVANIRSHAFFRGIDWEELEAGRLSPPFTPQTPSLEHLASNVDQSLQVPSRDPQEPPLTLEEQQEFRGFSFVSR